MSMLKNIAIVRGVAYEDTFDYPAVPPIANGFLGIMQFYESDHPLSIQLLSEKLGGPVGEVVPSSGIGFDIQMGEAKTRLLPDMNITYKFYKIDPITLNPIEIFNGNVNVTGETTEAVSNNEFNPEKPIELTGIAPIANCSLHNNFSIDLTGNTVVSLAQYGDGEVKSVKANNTGTNSFTIGFDCSGCTFEWPDGSQPAQTSGQTDLYTFQRWGDVIYAVVTQNFNG